MGQSGIYGVTTVRRRFLGFLEPERGLRDRKRETERVQPGEGEIWAEQCSFGIRGKEVCKLE